MSTRGKMLNFWWAAPTVGLLAHWDPAWIVGTFVGGLVLVVLVLVSGHPRAPKVITYLPQPTKSQRSGSKWIPGVTVRIPGIPFLSVGLWRWRGRK